MKHEHTTSVFDEDIAALQNKVLAMGGLVETAIDNAARALESRDEELAGQVIEGDGAIDTLEDEVNQMVLRFIALRQPAAGDLRVVLTMIRVAADLERLGDYAKNLAKRVSVLSRSETIDGASTSLRRQGRAVRTMLRDALTALARSDVKLAREVIDRDVEVDQMNNAMFREYLTHMMEDPRSITICMHLLFIAKNLERMGDHVTEICEQVIYLVTAERLSGRPKADTTATVAVPGDPIGD